MTEKFEGLRLTAYQDQVGVWTIGYGHTWPDVYPGPKNTENKATWLLLHDIGTAAGCVHRLVTVAGLLRRRAEAQLFKQGVEKTSKLRETQPQLKITGGKVKTNFSSGRKSR